MKFPIALQLYSVRDFIEKDLVETLKSIKDFGYDGVELAGLCGLQADELKKILDDVGLKAISAHVGFYEMRGDINKVIEDYKLLGCEYITIPGLALNDRFNTENGEKTIEDIKAFVKIFSDVKMPLCYHNHDWEFEKIGEEYIFDYLYKSVPDLLVQQDSCWVGVAGESPVKYLKKYANRTPLLHTKDYVGNKNEGNLELRPNGYGVQDFPAIIKTAFECGVKWLIVEQDNSSMDKTSLECAKLSIDYLNEVIK